MRSLLRADINVCELGYHWVDTDHGVASALHWGKSPEDRYGMLFGVEMSEDPDASYDHGDAGRWRSYDPFSEKRGLFLIFAELEPTREAIIEFASRYGCPASLRYLSNWQREILYLASAVEVWTAIQTKDEETLARHVSWDEVQRDLGLGPGFPSPLQTTIDSHEMLPVVCVGVGDFPPPDLIAPAEYLLDNTLAKKVKWQGVDTVPVRINGHLTFRVEFHDLLDVMWMQLATAISESQEFRQCKLCEDPFQLSPDVNRADRVFCSDTCRVKSYQRRQAKARKMRAAGAHLREIVKAVESNMKTVKRWLGEDK